MNRSLALALCLTSLFVASARAQATTAAHTPAHTLVVAQLQLIHNAAEAGVVDIYVDGRRIWDDVPTLSATHFSKDIPEGDRTIDIVAADAPDNSTPLWTTVFTFLRDENYVMTTVGNTGSDLLVRITDGARLAALSSDIEFMFIHGAPNIGPVDIRVQDPVSGDVVLLLANNFTFGDVLGYQKLAPAGYNIQVTNADNKVEIEVFRMELHRYGGEALVFLLTGPGVTSKDGLALVGYDVLGRQVTSSVITDTEGEAEVPNAFAIDGNYPNPFNPTTTLQFDLPETAQVSIQVIDLLGRQVMTVAPQMVEAGANRTLQLDAASLASGTYIYRVVAQTATDTMVKTGRMTLVK